VERLITATFVSCFVILSAPFMGQLRGALQAALPSGAYRVVVGVAVAGAVAVAVAVGVWRIRARRLPRYLALVAGLAIGVAYASLTASGNQNVDLVERVHFVEYGVLALLYFRVWRDRGDLTTLVAPLLACTIVALADEGVQWFVPGRVGEIRDVALDVVASGCGLLFALGLNPPARRAPWLMRRPAFAMGALAVAAVVAGAVFVSVIHLGHEIALGPSTLTSRFTLPELEGLARDRAARWSRDGAPTVLRPVSPEDQYLAEGVWHVQRRNEAADAGDVLAAWRENLILERLFGPVLDWPSYAARSPSRWPPEQRANIASQTSSDGRPYVSLAQPFPLFTWNRPAFWTVVAAALGVIWWVCLRGSETRSGVISR
jgi:hypothetical protein